MADLNFSDHGSIILMYVGTDTGQDWVDENIGYEDIICWGDGIAIEARYVGPIIEGAIADGLDVTLQ